MLCMQAFLVNQNSFTYSVCVYTSIHKNSFKLCFKDFLCRELEKYIGIYFYNSFISWREPCDLIQTDKC